MKNTGEKMRKITVNLPASLLDGVADENKSLTELMREALEDLCRKQASQKLARLRGTVNFGMSWQEMKEDRE